jgi:hypothetical protein
VYGTLVGQRVRERRQLREDRAVVDLQLSHRAWQLWKARQASRLAGSGRVIMGS